MAGDLEQARAAQQESVDIVHVIINHGGGIRGGKASMKLVGIDCGDCRLPLAPYTEAEIAGWTKNSGRSVSKSSPHTELTINTHSSLADSVPAVGPSGRSGTGIK